MSHDAAAIGLSAGDVVVPAGHPWTRLPLLGAAAFAIGAALLAVFGRANPERFFASWLVAFSFFLTIALGCLYFVLIHTVMQGGWGIVVRRIAENAAATVPVFALLFVPVVLGIHALYPWGRPGEVAHDHLLQWKAAYLNPTFFVARAVLFFAIWSAVALWFARLSRRQDQSKDEALSGRMRRLSGPLLIPVALAHTFAAVDWYMSLEPHWYSTIIGVYSFSGALVGGFAFMAVVALAMRRAGLLPGVFNAEHFHDLGKLLFAFTVFWAYIGFSQYFLIWYGNLPEETAWYFHRLEGSWETVSALLAVGHFAVPFFFLLPRTIKRRPATLFAAAAWMLLMHLVDVYWIVMPSLEGSAVAPGPVDLLALVAVGGAFVGVFARAMLRHPLVPVGDPRLPESLAFENV